MPFQFTATWLREVCEGLCVITRSLYIFFDNYRNIIFKELDELHHFIVWYSIYHWLLNSFIYIDLS